MKLERINDNQIRCTLNKQDLQDRELRINELAYGTEKAKELFRDMMQQASYELGFEAEDIPLMIEAIPVSTECLVLIITKVEDPDELDTRFSKFSSDQDADEYDFDSEDAFGEELIPTLSDVQDVSEDRDSEKDFVPLSDAIAPHNIIPSEQPKAANPAPAAQTIRIFSFQKLEEIIELAKELHTIYHGANSLYKDTEKEQYYLILSKDDHTLEEFNRICNLSSEFGKMVRSNYGTLSYYEEHFELIAKANAIGILYEL